jgi:hypothetical protein
MKITDLIKLKRKKTDREDVAQLKVGQLECNSLKVKHNFELGSFTATYKLAEDLGADDVVLVLEKMP